MEPQVKLRSIRHKATGKITTQSTNKTKRLLKSGQYVEVSPTGEAVDADRLAHMPLGYRQAVNNEQANARKAGRPLLWVGLACVSIAVLATGILLVIR